MPSPQHPIRLVASPGTHASSSLGATHVGRRVQVVPVGRREAAQRQGRPGMRKEGAPRGMWHLGLPGRSRCLVSLWDAEGPRAEKQQGRKGAGGERGRGHSPRVLTAICLVRGGGRLMHTKSTS